MTDVDKNAPTPEPSALALEHILSESLAASPVSVIITDHTQAHEPIIFVNRAFEELTGYKASEVLGLNPRFLHRDESDQQGLEVIRRALYQGQNCVSVIRDYRKDKTPIWVEVRISPVRNAAGRITNYIGFQRDLSSDMELEEQRDTFIAALAHDLKSPLTGADRILEAILDGRFGKLDATLENTIDLLRKSNQSAFDLVSNLLEEYRQREGPEVLHLESTNFVELVRSCVKEVEPHAKSQHLVLTTRIDTDEIECLVDKTSMRRVLINLLDNAIKFCRPGVGSGAIELCLAASSDRVVLAVKDNGIGISGCEMNDLFTKRKRGKMQKYRPGLGLGLYICRKIVTNHHGQISCESAPDIGTTFTVNLPRERG
ncbi:hypothetical protein BH10CYA1_BH10CYA1_13390 [soil metagenome]